MKRVKKLPLVEFGIQDVRNFDPCYDPIKYISEDWKGTVVDILKMKGVPPQDKIWVVCREEFLSASLLRRFAVAQAKTCRKHVKDKKEFDRILKVCLRYANGKTTQDELYAAESAARVARSAVRSAAWSAAESVARSVAVRMLLKMVLKEYSKWRKV